MRFFHSVNFTHPSLKSPYRFSQKEAWHKVNYELLKLYNQNLAPTNHNPITIKIDPKKNFYPRLRNKLEKKLSKAGYEVAESDGTFIFWVRRTPR